MNGYYAYLQDELLPFTLVLTGGLWQRTSRTPPGSVPAPPERSASSAASIGDRLSVVEVPHDNLQQISVSHDVVLWLAGGEHALPNLRFTALPNEPGGAPRWCLGVDADPAMARTKALAEGVERFAMGDFRFDDIRRAAANELDGDWLDPGSVAAYNPYQRQRLHLTSFNPGVPEWWVRGTVGISDRSTWLPAALVFSPFDGGETWLAPGYSSSNGVAAHTSHRAACRKAWYELVERDAFMRLYLAGGSPSRIPRKMMSALNRDIDDHISSQCIRSGAFLMRSTLGLPVIGYAAWSGTRLCLGASAGPSIAEATTKAMSEALVQVRHPFEGTLDDATEVRTPEDHGRLYANEAYSSSQGWLLDGPNVPVPTVDAREYERLESTAYYYVKRQDRWYVARCLDPRVLQLTFGYDNELLGHPAAINVTRGRRDVGAAALCPHPFA